MIIDALKSLFERDLNQLKQEIIAYHDEANLWKLSKEIRNSGGNLCLHLIGNLNTYIGQGLGNSNYVRDREFEFSGKDVPRQKLITDIDQTIVVVNQGLDAIDDNQLSDDFPILIWDSPQKMDFTIIHLHSHLNYHLGQINYHRRLLDEPALS